MKQARVRDNHELGEDDSDDASDDASDEAEDGDEELYEWDDEEDCCEHEYNRVWVERHAVQDANSRFRP
jgi:hypothetical protein